MSRSTQQATRRQPAPVSHHHNFRHPLVVLPEAAAATIATMLLINWLLVTLWPQAL